MERLHALDAVRAFALLAGVVLHATLSFLPDFGATGWPIADRSPSVPLAVTFYVIHIFRMTLFFTIAGFFARLLLHRVGTRAFIRNRAMRIALPFVVGWALVIPLILVAIAWASRAPQAVTITLPPPPPLAVPLTHLWFLYTLLLLYAVTLGVRAMVRRIDTAGVIGLAIDSAINTLARWSLVPVVLAMPVFGAFLSMSEWFRWFGVPTPDQSLVPPFAAAVAFTTAFAFGWFLHRHTHLLPIMERRWGLHLAISIIITVACISIAGPSPDFSGHATRFAVSYAGLYALGSWTWTFAIIGIALRFFAGESARMRYVSDASYWIYIAHVPVVFLLQAALMTLPWHWSVKFLVIMAVALPVLFAGYHVMVRRTVIGKVLNGRRLERLDE
jgi:glucan biosynthesis protein C